MTQPLVKRIPSAEERCDLYRAFSAWTSDPVMADDLVQQTMLEAWRSDRQPNAEIDWRPWLFGVARNVLLRWRRDMVKHGQRIAAPPQSADVLAFAASGDDLDDLLTRHEMIVLLDDLLGRLPTDTRQALLLKYIHELPQSEIAARMGLHEKALEGRLFRGRKALKQSLVTDRPDSAIDLGLIPEANVWQRTDIWCVTCGMHRLEARWFEDGCVRYDCPQCDNGWAMDGRRSHIYSGYPALSPHAPRPSLTRALSAVLAPMHDHSALGRDASWPCASCSMGSVRPHAQLTTPEQADEVGLRAPNIDLLHVCDRCGAIEFASVLSRQPISRPSGQAFLELMPRVRMLPPRIVDYHGREAFHSTWESLDGEHAFHAWMDLETWLCLDIETTVSISGESE